MLVGKNEQGHKKVPTTLPHLHKVQPREAYSYCSRTFYFIYLFLKTFLIWTIFKVFIEFCYNIASVLCFLATRHVES